MKAPSFWYQPPSIYSKILTPTAWIYEHSERFLRSLKKPKKLTVPIISIGNIVCGGSGKTPTSLALGQILQQKGHPAHFVTRGYKGKKQGPHKVNLSFDSYKDVGDESLLLASQNPTWVAKNKVLGAIKSIKNGAKIIILDDGHQTTGLYKDLSLVVVDLNQSFGNGSVVPAGPLRENLQKGLERADAIIRIGKGDLNISKPIFTARIIPTVPSLPKKPCVAFCGLGFPEKFYSSLKDLGLEVKEKISFPDHYHYKNSDLIKLLKLSEEKNSFLVTTRKDFVKIPPPWQNKVYVLDIKIQFDDEEALYRYMCEKIPILKERM